jgi:branched-chain amino acid transport system ATP-binding protein
MLQVDSISVTFGGVRALDEVSLSVEANRVTGLIGPNGAGKTTLFNVVTGLQRPRAGRVLLGGVDVTGKGPKARARMGLGRTFQRLEVFGSLSAVDNVLVAVESSGVRGRAARARADELLAEVGLAGSAATQADVLPTGMARLLELARALACGPRVLLLDEPFSGLNSAEGQRLAELVGRLAGQGLAILLVEHDMEMVMKLCRHIYVLSFGALIAQGPPDAVRSDPAVQEAYLGAPAAAGAEQ